MDQKFLKNQRYARTGLAQSIKEKAIAELRAKDHAKRSKVAARKRFLADRFAKKTQKK